MSENSDSDFKLDLGNNFPENLEIPKSSTVEEFINDLEEEMQVKEDQKVSKKSDKKSNKSNKSTKTSNKKKVEKSATTKKRSTKKSVIVPSEITKTQFSTNFFIGFVNSYYRNIYKKLSFIRDKEGKQLIGSKTLDLNHLEVVDRLRKFFESDYSDNEICDPYLYTARGFFNSYQKNEYLEHFEDLCKNFLIEDANIYEIDKLIDQMVEIATNNKLEARVFNYVFGPVYAEKHKDKTEVHLRYIQRAPEDLMQLLKIKSSSFKASLDNMFDPSPSKKTLLTKYISGSRLNGQEVIDYIKNKTKDKKGIFSSMKKSQIIEKYHLDGLTPSEIQDEINKMQKIVSTVQSSYNFMKYLSEIDDQELFEKLVGEVKTSVDRFKHAATEIKQLQDLSRKALTNTEKWKYLISIIVKFGHAYKYVISEPKDKKSKEPISSIMTHIKKNNCIIGISKKLKDELNDLILNNYNQAQIFEVAEKYVSEISNSSTPHAYHPFNNQVYSKIGYLIFNNWKCDKQITKISKNMRIAIGMTIFKYIDMEIQKFMSSGKISRIVIKN